MAAYYNEHDRQKAAWIHELMKAGVVAQGDVDERDIKLVAPDDLKGYDQCHFFAGIAVWSYALRLAGWPDDRPVWTGSCPCPSFSSAGKGQGFDDPRHLWPDWFRLIRQCRPPVIFGEQADAAIGFGWIDLVQVELETEVYALGKAVLGACSVGSPQIRKRLYFVADTAGIGFDGRGQLHRGAEESFQPSSSQRREGWHKTQEPCAAVELEHSDSERCGEARDCDSGSGACGRSSSSELADCDIGRQPMHGREGGRLQYVEQCGESINVEHSECDGRRQSAEILRPRESVVPTPSIADDVGDTSSRRLPFCQDERPSTVSEACQGRAVGAPGGINGFWRDADWILRKVWNSDDFEWCPVEPGTFPLAHGAPARVLRLRGYGDAIVPQVAQVFIQAYLEARRCMSVSQSTTESAGPQNPA